MYVQLVIYYVTIDFVVLNLLSNVIPRIFVDRRLRMRAQDEQMGRTFASYKTIAHRTDTLAASPVCPEAYKSYECASVSPKNELEDLENARRRPSLLQRRTR